MKFCREAHCGSSWTFTCPIVAFFSKWNILNERMVIPFSKREREKEREREGGTRGGLEKPEELTHQGHLIVSALWETAPPARFMMCWAKPTWMGGVVLLPLKMEVRLVIFSPLD